MHLSLISDEPAGLLFDENRDTITTLEAALGTHARRLGDERRRKPGAYLLLYRGELPMYGRLRRPSNAELGSIVADGGYPIYAGSALDLAERAGRHLLKATGTLGGADLVIVGLATASLAGALYAERMLIDQFRPVWNESWLAGWGSKRQGRTRTAGQRPSPWSQLHDARREALGQVSASERCALAERVVDHLERTVPTYAAVCCHAVVPRDN